MYKCTCTFSLLSLINFLVLSSSEFHKQLCDINNLMDQFPGICLNNISTSNRGKGERAVTILYEETATEGKRLEKEKVHVVMYMYIS